jgi:hypothetical protein
MHLLAQGKLDIDEAGGFFFLAVAIQIFNT